jgi:hypothetical protein
VLIAVATLSSVSVTHLVDTLSVLFMRRGLLVYVGGIMEVHIPCMHIIILVM